jgi:uncharacterized membrane protein YdjX (TVP38/TMEM64 family)
MRGGETVGSLTTAETLPKERRRRVDIGVGLASIGLGAAIVLAVPELRHAVSLSLHGDLEGLRHLFLGLGAWGVALLVALMLVHAVVFYPTEVLTATAGLVYGFLPGLALVTVGWLVSALLAYLLGRTVGEPLARLLFGARRFAAFERAVKRGGVPLLLAARLVPLVPFSMTGYVAGAVRVPLWRFGWTTVVGYLPLTTLMAYLGSRSRSLSPGDPRLWIGLALMILMLGAAQVLRPRVSSSG